MQSAERAGVGAGTLYRNFPAKKDLVAAVVVELAQSFEEAVAAALDDESAPGALEFIIRAGFDLTGRYGRLLLDLLGGGAGQGPATGSFNRETVRARIREICRRGVQRGEFPEDLDVEFALGMLQGLFAPRALEFLLGTHKPTEIADLAVVFYLRGLGARPRKP